MALVSLLIFSTRNLLKETMHLLKSVKQKLGPQNPVSPFPSLPSYKRTRANFTKTPGILMLLFVKTLIKFSLPRLGFKALQKGLLPCSLTQCLYEPSSGSVHCSWSTLHNASLLLSWRPSPPLSMTPPQFFFIAVLQGPPPSGSLPPELALP